MSWIVHGGWKDTLNMNCVLVNGRAHRVPLVAQKITHAENLFSQHSLRLYWCTSFDPLRYIQFSRCAAMEYFALSEAGTTAAGSTDNPSWIMMEFC